MILIVMTQDYTGMGQDWEKQDSISGRLLQTEEDSLNCKIIWKMVSENWVQWN